MILKKIRWECTALNMCVAKVPSCCFYVKGLFFPFFFLRENVDKIYVSQFINQMPQQMYVNILFSLSAMCSDNKHNTVLAKARQGIFICTTHLGKYPIKSALPIKWKAMNEVFFKQEDDYQSPSSGKHAVIKIGFCLFSIYDLEKYETIQKLLSCFVWAQKIFVR